MRQLKIPAGEKIFEGDALTRQLQRWHDAGDEIVFTNGCFDILHAGHIAYLEAAAKLGDRLIIGVNDDASVKRLKGETRPINVLASRLFLLGSLNCVDAVISFSEDTPLALINLLKPDILVKGGDYKVEQIAGSKEVIANGGRVVINPIVEGFSTTGLIDKINKL